MSVVIIGASLAGTRTAQTLRRRGYEGSIVVVGDEPEAPYDRPPLSKEFLASPDATAHPLLRGADLEASELELRTSTAAVGLDPVARTVSLSDGETLPYTSLVIATGASPRQLQVTGHDLPGVHVLRTLADARELRDALGREPRIAVLGGGFIGAEFASAARSRGLDVSIIERAAAPFAQGLGEHVGHLLSRPHLERGVTLHTRAQVTAVLGSEHAEALALADGSRIDCDLVLVGIGVTPATAWLDGSGVAVDDGVVCDSQLRSVSTPHVWAAGDVARWHHPLLDRSARIEHWTNANEHAEVVAASILGDEARADAVPYVWSDQYGSRMQLVGRPGAADQVSITSGDEDSLPLRVTYSRDGLLTALLVVDDSRLVVKARKAIRAGTPVADFTAQHLSPSS